ncbi:MAG: hypothetical protein ACE5EX_03170 [Phycisphaerae bacterium]
MALDVAPQADDLRRGLDNRLRTGLRRVAGRARRYVLIEGLAWITAFLLAAGILQFLADYGTHGLRWSMRAALLALILGSAMWMFARRVVRPLRHRFTTADIAKLVERRFPELQSLLVSAVRFSDGEVGGPTSNSRTLMASVVASAGRQAASVDIDTVLDARRGRRAGASLVAVLACFAAVCLIFDEHSSLWFARNVLLQEVEWPRRTDLIVDMEGEELIGARGDDLVVQAHALGVQPRVVEIVFETTGGQKGRETMVTVGSRDAYGYRYTFKNAQEDFTFHLEGGDDRTKTIQARLLERPRVTETEMRIVPPAYTKLEAYTIGDGQRRAEILPGSEVTISVGTNKPVVRAALMAGRDLVSEATAVGERFVATVSPMETHTYHFALTDDVGLDNRRPVRFSLRVTEDEAPRVRLRLGRAGDMITADAVLPFELEFSDTYGLASAELVYELSRGGTAELAGGRARDEPDAPRPAEGNDSSAETDPSTSPTRSRGASIPLTEFRPYMTTFSTSLSWPVSEVVPVPGDTLTFQVRASDFNTVTGPGEAQSAQITVRVVTREELLAEMARREQEYRADFERLIDSQEQLRRSLLTVFGHFRDEPQPDTLVAELSPLERRQRNIAGAVNVIRQQFEQILAELAVNQLDTREERQRLGERIIEPLKRLAKRDLVAAADSVRDWSREASTERAAVIDPLQVQILSKMRSVLASMLQWEGYQEVVNMLRDIIRLQQELRSETENALQEQGSDVFDN